MSDLIVIDTVIGRDAEGRYCLNDLHKAAGGEDKHKPFNFLRLDTTKALIEELSNCSDLSSLTPGNPEINSSDLMSLTPGIPGANCADLHSLAPVVTVEGRGGGTFVVKELVYAYAMWISPAFHIRVIRAYDELVSSPQSSRLGDERRPRSRAIGKERDFIDRKTELALAYERVPTPFARQSVYEAMVRLHGDHGESLSEELVVMHQENMPTEHPEVKKFWEVFELFAEAEKLNHSINTELIAFNFPELERFMKEKETGLASPGLLRKLLPRSRKHIYLRQKTVRSAITGGGLHCWVFQRGQ